MLHENPSQVAELATINAGACGFVPIPGLYISIHPGTGVVVDVAVKVGVLVALGVPVGGGEVGVGPTGPELQSQAMGYDAGPDPTIRIKRTRIGCEDCISTSITRPLSPIFEGLNTTWAPGTIAGRVSDRPELTP